MRAFGVAVFTIVLLACLPGSNACSCLRGHPQEQFCRASFVVKASVVSRQFIYETTPPPATDSVSDYSDSSFLMEEESNSTEMQGPPELQRMPPAGFLAPMAMNDFPPSNREDRRPIKLEFTIKVDKVFKGDNIIMERTLAKIYTPPYDGLCGADLANDVSYVISGSFYNNELNFGLCNWVVPYKSLSRIQRRGVKLMYKKTCGECSIGSCYGSTCKFVPDNADRCMLDISSMGNSCEEQHSFCARSKKSCKWQRNRDYKKCYSRIP